MLMTDRVGGLMVSEPPRQITGKAQPKVAYQSLGAAASSPKYAPALTRASVELAALGLRRALTLHATMMAL